MERIFKWLFGEDINTQEEKIKKLLCWTVAMLAGMVILVFINLAYAEAMIAVICLMWGWRVVKATAKVNKITELFDYNVVVFAVVITLWLTLGYFAGMIYFVLGIIRYIQIKKLNY